MSEAGLSHCGIVQETLAGNRAAEEQTFASLEVLTERLERVRQLGGSFSEVEFSADAGRLRHRKKAVAVG